MLNKYNIPVKYYTSHHLFLFPNKEHFNISKFCGFIFYLLFSVPILDVVMVVVVMVLVVVVIMSSLLF